MSAVYFLAGLAAVILGGLIALGAAGLAAVLGGMLVVAGAVLLSAAGIIESVDSLRRAIKREADHKAGEY